MAEWKDYTFRQISQAAEELRKLERQELSIAQILYGIQQVTKFNRSRNGK